MKATHATRLVCGVLVVLASLNVSAQESVAASATAKPAASDAKTVKAADRALQKNVLRALSKTRGLRVSAITVRARNGVVTLEGTVPEQSQVGLAAQAAEAVEGVKSVTNALSLSTL
ncbi:BON domain-containing protein [Paraburkholderia sediminicola]|uniref:BON domain-containing protein n=1 Tax=Paraburkholderia sediminicola TaxID=458836 RepID=UPI0038BC6155